MGLHFFNPAPISPLIEVIVPADVEPTITDAALALVEQLGKTAIRSGDTPGFIVNRLLIPHLNRALGLATSLGDARQVDAVFRDKYGFPLGPCRLVDLIGADTVLLIQRNLHDAFPDDAEPPHAMLED
ncbi:3-hydroxyacyl-CoA dehydrogenase family protein [Rathayibacter tritici]|uniref:3-hydroxyacyl-CoA dehydrogenase family protein n=1 Tax=Rathayibacter tritici TaxID=33888 RepID=UPI0021505CAE|nr:3-hydroxyacyl-CoA dehydrogenase family protein [Rathayibacter tritici]